ncbi:NAD-dependent epimerase/dehydratase family protein [Roseateles sp. BYS87W]|uniref:NAD-dependent epimerase/dehydratase family protein n=1 Tax=Pelomonas baiyunensis TaxID=3299026 RepID=A0ABW7GVI4_9BURK
MRVLIVGAGGFIGRHVVAALQQAGHEAVRGAPRPVTTWEQPSAWQPLLRGVDAVVYTAGCLRDRAGGVSDLLDLLHHRAPAALASACEAAGIRQLVHLSALCGGVSAYARSKHAGDTALAGRACIVRPSLVVGVGGTSSRMLDRLAWLPWLALPPQVARCRVQPVHVQDLAAGIVAFLQGPSCTGTWDAVGPEPLTVADCIARRRAARGLAPARLWALPWRVSRASARLGDLLAWGPWCSTALELLAHDSVGDTPPAAAAQPATAHPPLAQPLRDALAGAWA